MADLMTVGVPVISPVLVSIDNPAESAGLMANVSAPPVGVTVADRVLIAVPLVSVIADP